MPQNYNCDICGSKPDQLSHHKSHLDTQKHKAERTIFQLQLEKMSDEQIQEKYKNNDIADIIKKKKQ